MAILQMKNGDVVTVVGNISSDATEVMRLGVYRGGEVGKEVYTVYVKKMVDRDTGVTPQDYTGYGFSLEHALGALLCKLIANRGAVVSIDGLPIVIE